MLNKNFVITIATVFFSIIAQFIYIRYVSYHVDRDIYGNFILIQTLIGFLSLLLEVPNQAYKRFYGEAKNKSSYINEFRTMFLFANIISLVPIAIYGYIMAKFDLDILIIVFVYFLFLSHYSLNQQIFLLNLERKKYFYFKSLDALSQFIAPIVSYFYFQTLFSLIFGLTMGYFISFIATAKYRKNYPFKININMENYKKYVIFAYPTLFTFVFSWGLSSSDRYFIEFFHETKDVAIYAILAQVAGIGQIIGQIYSMYVNPIVLKMHVKSKKSAFNYIDKTLKYIIVIFLVLAFIMYNIPHQVYGLLIDIEIIQQEYFFNTFMILAIGIFLLVFHLAMSMYFILLKKMHILSYINGVAFVANIIGNLFIESYGIIAAAVSTLTAYAILNIGTILFIRKYRYT